jgi:cytochrome c biogenesis factor
LGKTSLLSREALFLLAALLFGGFFLVCFWGILYPLIYEIFSGQKITFGPSFYRQPVAAILASLMLLMGVAPLSSWTYGTIKTIGRSIWKPAIPALLVTVVLAFRYISNLFQSGLTGSTLVALVLKDVIALIGFTLIAFVIFVALFEFWRSWGKSAFKTLWPTLWMPLVPSAIILGVLVILGVHDWIALIWCTLVTFATFMALFEIWRAWNRSIDKTSWRALWLPLIVSVVILGALVFLVGLTILGVHNWIATIVSLMISLPAALGQWASRNRRRYGGYLIHIAMVIMALGIIGIEVFQTTTQKSLAVGESIQISGYSIRFDSLAQFPASDGRWVTRAVMSVFRDGKYLGELHPRYDLFADGQPMTIPAVRSTLADDLYVVLVNWESISQAQAPFKVYHNPLVIWLWIGSFVFIGGILVAAWPEREGARSEK